MSYEDILIREITEGDTRWCSQCERAADDCACEELSDHFNGILPVPVLAEPSANLARPERKQSATIGGEAREGTDGIARKGDHSRDGQKLCSVGDSDTDVRVFPAVSENARGSEAEPYTYAESETRRKEWNED